MMGGEHRGHRHRARKHTEKLRRRDEILKAGAEIFADASLEGLTMAAVARRCCLAKGTIYLYFSSKEALLAELLLEHYRTWLEELTAAVAKEAQPVSAGRLGVVLEATLADKNQFLLLLGLQHGVIERNLDPSAAVRLQMGLRDLFAEGGGILEHHVARLAPGTGARFLRQLHGVMVGLAQLAHPSPTMMQALRDEPELNELVIDFGSELRAISVALLRGGSLIAPPAPPLGASPVLAEGEGAD